MKTIPFLRRPSMLLTAAIVAVSLPALASAADLRQRLPQEP